MNTEDRRFKWTASTRSSKKRKTTWNEFLQYVNCCFFFWWYVHCSNSFCFDQQGCLVELATTPDLSVCSTNVRNFVWVVLYVCMSLTRAHPMHCLIDSRTRRWRLSDYAQESQARRRVIIVVVIVVGLVVVRVLHDCWQDLCRWFVVDAIHGQSNDDDDVFKKCIWPSNNNNFSYSFKSEQNKPGRHTTTVKLSHRNSHTISLAHDESDCANAREALSRTEAQTIVVAIAEWDELNVDGELYLLLLNVFRVGQTQKTNNQYKESEATVLRFLEINLFDL